MKNNKLKLATITLLIVLIALVSFLGVYTQDKAKMKNNVKGFDYASDLGNSRVIILNPTADNNEEDKNKDNYNRTKSIIEGRLKALNNTIMQENGTSSEVEKLKVTTQDFQVSVNEESGEIVVKLPENENASYVSGLLSESGNFQIVDKETGEAILTKQNIAKAYVATYTSGSKTETAFKIEFNSEGKSVIGALRDESKAASSTTTSEEKATEVTTEGQANTTETNTTATETETETSQSTSMADREYILKINEEDSYTATIDKMFVDNIITLSIGEATSSKTELKSYLAQAQNLIAVLTNEDLPLKYEVSTTETGIIEFEEEVVTTVLSIIVMVLAVLTFVILAIRYKKDGLLMAISNVGFSALLLLLVKYGSVTVSMEGITALFFGLVVNLICISNILKNIKQDEKDTETKKILNHTLKDMTLKIIPLFIIAIVFTFTKRTPANSFGMVMFWGLTLVILYNLTFTKLLLKYGKQK